MEKRNSVYYEFWKDGAYISTGFKTLNNIEIQTGIDTVPTMTLTIPISELPKANTNSPLSGYEVKYARYEIHVFIQTEGKTKYKFFGIVDNAEMDFANYSVTFNLSHRIARMREWIMPVNYAVKNTDFDFAIGKDGCQLGSSSTIHEAQSYDMEIDIEMIVNEMPKLEMTFSSTNKLAALTEACENTEKLHWRVDLSDREQDHIIISEFGDRQNVLISPNPLPAEDCSGTDNSSYVTMLTEPVYSIDYTNHFNRAVVFCGDIGYGIMHLTLKSLYDIKSYREDKEFPIGKYDKEINLKEETAYADESASEEEKCRVAKINNEKFYTDNEMIIYADNDNREFFVTDTRTLDEIDGGIVKQTIYNFSDLYPIPKLDGVDYESDKCEKIEYMITDEDRLEITKRAYARAVRNLKAQRPVETYQFNAGALPGYVQDGDKVEFAYSKKMFPQFPEEIGAECRDNDTEPETVVNIKGELYLTKRTIIFDEVLNEYTTVTLDAELRPRAISAVEIELTRKIEEETTTPNKTTTPNNTVTSPTFLGNTNTDVSNGTPSGSKSTE